MTSLLLSSSSKPIDALSDNARSNLRLALCGLQLEPWRSEHCLAKIVQMWQILLAMSSLCCLASIAIVGRVQRLSTQPQHSCGHYARDTARSPAVECCSGFQKLKEGLQKRYQACASGHHIRCSDVRASAGPHGSQYGSTH